MQVHTRTSSPFLIFFTIPSASCALSRMPSTLASSSPIRCRAYKWSGRFSQSVLSLGGRASRNRTCMPRNSPMTHLQQGLGALVLVLLPRLQRGQRLRQLSTESRPGAQRTHKVTHVKPANEPTPKQSSIRTCCCSALMAFCASCAARISSSAASTSACRSSKSPACVADAPDAAACASLMSSSSSSFSPRRFRARPCSRLPCRVGSVSGGEIVFETDYRHAHTHTRHFYVPPP